MPFVDNAGFEDFQHLFDDFFVVVTEKSFEYLPVIIYKDKGAKDKDFEARISFYEIPDSFGVDFN